MSAFSAAFLRGEPPALGLLADDFRRATGRVGAVRRAAERTLAAPVLEALRSQAARRPMSEARRAALDALAKPRTVAVVTGQQVGLFLGPLYSFYKAASAVVTARALERKTGARCVPIFWLQTEDHDLDEIDHLEVSDAQGTLSRITLASAHTPRASVSSVRLGEAVGTALRELADSLAGAARADEVLALFGAHYRPDATWAEAFAGVLSEVLPDLVILDPRHEALAEQARHVYRRAFADCEDIYRVLRERQRQLEAAGFDVQVHLRDGSPLCFVHPDGRDGPRFRVERCAEGWRIAGSDRLAAPGDDPLSVSTSALLRPIVQDSLLPTAAVVVGPGELNYFAQLPPLYAHFGLPMPMVVPRARFRVVEPRVARLLRRLGLSPEDVEAPREAILRRLMPVAPELTPEALERRLLEAAAPVLDSVPGVDDAVRRARLSIARTARRLASRCATARRNRDTTLMERLDRVQRALHPLGQPQERVLGFPTFAARFGVAEFSSLVLESVAPFSTTVRTLWPTPDPAGAEPA